MTVAKLRDGESIVGTMVRMVRNPAIAQLAYRAGLDFIMLDMEHGAYSIETFSDVAKVARSLDMGVFARVPELAKGYVSRVMDAGANGVMVPMISNEEEAKNLARWARYPPMGIRGLGSTGVHTSFDDLGFDARTFMAKQNESTLAIAQIETKAGVENIDKIAAVEGIDVLLIGPNDLAISLGVPGETQGETVQKAIDRVMKAATEHGKVFGMHAGDALLQKGVSQGMQMVMNTLDINILRSGFSAIVEKYKK